MIHNGRIDEKSPRTWRELEQAIAFNLGWRLCEYEVTPDDPSWSIAKSTHGKKYYVESKWRDRQTVTLRPTVDEALEDLPHYALSEEDCREIVVGLPRDYLLDTYVFPWMPHLMCLQAAKYFQIGTESLPIRDDRVGG
jgi:hypothetical protein